MTVPRKCIRRGNLAGAGRCLCALGQIADAARLPFAGESADLVIAFMCLHDFDDMSAAVAEAARILTPGGRFAVALAPRWPVGRAVP
jgi:SAM-dependent methyltransferase